MYAAVAAHYIRAYAKGVFKDSDRMESTMANGEMIDAFDIVGTGTHKYIPAEKLTIDLGMTPGAGVYSYVKFTDGSYLLLTCKGPVAYWSGKQEDQAKWPEDRKELI